MKIMLDAGHGLHTPGKQTPGGSMHEWEFNAATAQYVKDILVNYEKVEVLFAHDPSGQVDIALQKRTDYANQCGAEVYVSIHANANGETWGPAKGIETFVYKTNPASSRKLADVVQKKLIERTNRQDRGVKTADFQVLRETHMPAILCECGFMTNQEEATLLKSADYRIKCAGAIADGLIQVYGLKPKAKPVEPVKVASSGVYRVQVGAFTNKANADKLAGELKAKGYPVIVVH